MTDALSQGERNMAEIRRLRGDHLALSPITGAPVWVFRRGLDSIPSVLVAVRSTEEAAIAMAESEAGGGAQYSRDYRGDHCWHNRDVFGEDMFWTVARMIVDAEERE